MEDTTKDHNGFTEENASPEQKRIRRTKAEMEAARKAEVDAIRLELLSELRERGLLKDESELEKTPDQETLELLPFNVIVRNIQSEIKVRKGNSNVGDNGQTYFYRTAEEILAASKGVCAKYGCHIDTTARVEYHSDMFCYIVVDATLTRDETGESVTRSAAAREDPKPRGTMSAAQGSGSCITYAKKYALDNLLALENPEADPDSVRRCTERLSPADLMPHEDDIHLEIPANASKPIRKGTKSWNRYKEWAKSRVDLSNDDLREIASKKAAFTDELWIDLLKETGRYQ